MSTRQTLGRFAGCWADCEPILEGIVGIGSLTAWAGEDVAVDTRCDADAVIMGIFSDVLFLPV